MKILVVSDSHGRIRNLERVIKKVANVDMMIHLGDVQGDELRIKMLCKYPVEFVRGNCDFCTEAPIMMTICIPNHKIFATHGHMYKVDWELDELKKSAKEQGCDIALYGHTHVPQVIYGEDVNIANPGSISKPRQYNHKPSYMVIETVGDTQIHFGINYI